MWGYHPEELSLYHRWVYNAKPHAIAQNTFKYIRIDPVLRESRRLEWNRPLLWPVACCLIFLCALALPALIKRARTNRMLRVSAPDADSGRRS